MKVTGEDGFSEFFRAKDAPETTTKREDNFINTLFTKKPNSSINNNRTNNGGSLIFPPKGSTTEGKSSTNILDAMRNVNSRTTSSSAANGQIDQPYRQGATGDCWLIASIYTISQNPRGLKILNDSITVLPDGKIKVTLKGVGKSYTYTQSQINSKGNLSKGDLDVRAIEMAMNDYMREHPQNGRNNIDGNAPNVAFRLLTGKSGSYAYHHKFTSSEINSYNDKNTVRVVACNKQKRSVGYDSQTGQKVNIINDHTYAIKGSDAQYVYLVDPTNTAKTIKMKRADFTNFFEDIYTLKL